MRKKLIDSINRETKKMDYRYTPGLEPIEVPMMPIEMWEAKLSYLSIEELEQLEKDVIRINKEWKE